MKSTLAYIALGANLGDPIDTLLTAIDELRALAQCSQLQSSGFYRTAPVDATGPDYINAVVSLQTTLDAPTLLANLHAIEQAHGRERNERNAPRTLDLDLLLFGDEHINTEALTVPHPRMHLRAFVLRPLAELAPSLQLEQGTITALLQTVADQAIFPLDTNDDD